jgi:hypothetical protein
MSTTLLYALIMAIAQIVVSLISFFLGYQTDKINNGGWFGIIPLIVSIVILFLGIKAVREEQAGKYLTYGKGVGTGVLISLYAGLIGALYTYVHFTYINPNFPDYLIEASRIKWAAAGMSESKMEAAEKGLRMFTKPLLQSVFGIIASVFFGLILSLIISAFLKRNPPGESEVAS